MTPTQQPMYWWQGYVNQLTYSAAQRRWVDDEFVAHLADELIRQRLFNSPVETCYQATVDGLESGERLSHGDEDKEEATRDLLGRLLQALDQRRPWPVPPFTRVDPSEWPAFRSAPVIGRILLSEKDLGERLNRVFSKVSSGDGEAKLLILRLRTGEVVALLAPNSYVEPGVVLLAHTDPVATLAAFYELTGIKVEAR